MQDNSANAKVDADESEEKERGEDDKDEGGLYYYYNRVTGQSQWEIPRELELQEEGTMRKGRWPLLPIIKINLQLYLDGDL